MKGVLKSKPPGTQLLILIAIAVASLFILGLIGTWIVSRISGVSIGSMLDITKIEPDKAIMFIRGSQIVQFISLFLLPCLFCAYLYSERPDRYLGLKEPSNVFYWVTGVLVMIVALPFVEWLGVMNREMHLSPSIDHWLTDKEDSAQETFVLLLNRHTLKDLIINVVVIAGLAAVGEELLFRGMLQKLFIRIFKNPWVGIIVTAIIFSAIHFQFYGFLPRFALGVLLGVIYWYSGSLWASMLAHFIYDGLLIVLAYLNPSMMTKDDTVVNFSNVALVGLISLTIVAALVTWMAKKSRTTFTGVYAEDMAAVNDNPFSF